MLVYCGHTVGWIKMKLGTEVGLGPGHIVLDGDPAPPEKDTAPPPLFWPMNIVAKRSPISATAIDIDTATDLSYFFITSHCETLCDRIEACVFALSMSVCRGAHQREAWTVKLP